MQQLAAPFPVNNLVGSYARSCSADGSLIGGDARPLGVNQSRAVVWHPQMGPIDLTAYATFRGVDLHGNTLLTVERVSDDGGMIAGLASDGTTSVYVLNLHVLFPCSPADLGSHGGAVGPDGYLDNNDFVVFIQLFLAADPVADMGSAGGFSGADGAVDNNDFVAFIDRFFTGCV